MSELLFHFHLIQDGFCHICNVLDSLEYIFFHCCKYQQQQVTCFSSNFLNSNSLSFPQFTQSLSSSHEFVPLRWGFYQRLIVFNCSVFFPFTLFLLGWVTWFGWLFTFFLILFSLVCKCMYCFHALSSPFIFSVMWICVDSVVTFFLCMCFVLLWWSVLLHFLALLSLLVKSFMCLHFGPFSYTFSLVRVFVDLVHNVGLMMWVCFLQECDCMWWLHAFHLCDVYVAAVGSFKIACPSSCKS